MMADNGGLDLRAEVLSTRKALLTVGATRGIPTDTDALTDFQSFRRRANGSHSANDFVTEHGGILGEAPLIIPNGHVGMAEATVLDRDFNLFGSKWSEVDLLAYELLLRCCGDPGLDGGHSYILWEMLSLLPVILS